jgi:hypothetical protein
MNPTKRAGIAGGLTFEDDVVGLRVTFRKKQYLTWVKGPSVRFAMSCIAIYRKMFLKMDPPKMGFGIADSLNR